MRVPLIGIGSALLFALAGVCVFLVLLNRILIFIQNEMAKALAICVSFTLLVVIGGSSGFFVTSHIWSIIPVALLILVVLGEVHRLFIRRACSASPPIDTIPHEFNLARPITTTDLIVHRYQVSPSKWQGDPLRIVHLTDLHVNSSLPLEYYREVLSVAEEQEPDIAVFTGDFISKLDALPALAEVLRPIARLETFAVLGNHDYWEDAGAIQDALTRSGVHVLANDSAKISHGSSTVVISGYDYPWGTKDRYVTSQKGDALHIVLSHSPDNIYRISRSRADVAFSGHFHAGQIRVPLVGSVVVPSVYGRRFDHGHFMVDGTHLFVASGVGAADPPLRIYCQPDIFVVDIVQEDSPGE